MSSIYQQILLLVFVNQMFTTECDAGHLLVKAATQTEAYVTDKRQTLQEKYRISTTGKYRVMRLFSNLTEDGHSVGC